MPRTKGEGTMNNIKNTFGYASIITILAILVIVSSFGAFRNNTSEKPEIKHSEYKITSEDVFTHDTKLREAEINDIETDTTVYVPETETAAEQPVEKPADIQETPASAASLEPASTSSPASVEGEFTWGQNIGRVYSSQLGIDCSLIFGATNDFLSYGAVLHKNSNLSSAVDLNKYAPVIGAHCTTYFYGFKALEPYIGSAPSNTYISIIVGNTELKYRITSVKIMNKDAFSFPFEIGDNSMAVFYTCYPFEETGSYKTDRMFVYCEKVN